MQATYSGPVQPVWQWHASVGAPSWSMPVCTTSPCMHVYTSHVSPAHSGSQWQNCASTS